MQQTNCLLHLLLSSPMNVFILIVAIIFLLALNGLFVAAEFAAISVKKQRLAQLVEEENLLARHILEMAEDPHKLDLFVSTCQLGITVSSLVLGSYGQAQLIQLLAPLFQQITPNSETVATTVATILVLLVLTVLQVILSELVPKNISLRNAEGMALFTARPLLFLQTIFRPLILLLNGSGALVLRLLGQKVAAEHSHVHTPEEIVILLEQSNGESQLDQEERTLLVNTLALRNQRARKVMIPRNRIVAGNVDESIEDLLATLAQSRFSRLPIYDGTIDNIIGMVHLKDLLLASQQPHLDNHVTVSMMLHPIEEVPDSLEVQIVMERMQRNRHHLAIVVDEYGGTAGMLTFEDLIEEIIGEFRDEFDRGELPPHELRNRNELWLRGDLQVEELNELIEGDFPTEEADTVGGLIANELGRVPEVGERAEIAGYYLRVERMMGQGLMLASMLLTPQQVTTYHNQQPGKPLHKVTESLRVQRNVNKATSVVASVS
ncbi:MAG: hemolysin family protein [Caldilineaceae bacterium]